MFAVLWPHLNERQRRLLLAAEARHLGRGGVTRVAVAAGVSRQTVHQALHELEAPPGQPGRVRRPGGGRKKTVAKDPGVVADLEALVDPQTRGDPMSPLRWTCKSTRQLALALAGTGHHVSHRLVAALLHQQGYSLQAAVKTREGSEHPDRDAQFHYLNDQAQAFVKAGWPVISVDTKKKELVGPFKNGGQEWQPKGQPDAVNVHDFVDPTLGKAIPYGVYDVARNRGWVNVGQDHDTAAFAVESVRRWWANDGRAAYPAAQRVLICADSGGSNGYRRRLWKRELARWAADSALSITVCHLPPGTSKWNKIEHRLFAHIAMNWRERPLTSYEVVVSLISATTTQRGLHVAAALDTGTYPLGVEVSDDEFAAIPIRPHEFHGEWHYTIDPRPSPVENV